MKNKIFLSFFLIFFILFITCYTRLHANSATPKELHVFLEAYATNPAFSQIINYTSLDQNIRKIIAWHRFPNRSALINLKEENTIEIPLKSGEFHWRNSTYRVLSATLLEMIKNPDLQLYLHVNKNKMNTVIRPFLTWIPKNKIAHIYLYEDGYGELYKEKYWLKKNQKHFSIEELKAGLNSSSLWDDQMILYLHRFYPVTYYFFEYDTAKNDPQFNPMIEFLKDLEIRNINFENLRKTLSNSQKQKIYRLSGFDYHHYADLMKNKKNIVYLMGYHPIDKENNEYERTLLHRLRQDDTFSGIHGSDYQWFYKPHPSFQTTSAAMKMRKEFPDMIEISAQIPFEIFILAGLRPDYVAGYSSSAFYPMKKNEILYIIQRPWDDYHGRLGDSYLTFLKKVRHIDKQQIRTFSSSLNSANFSYLAIN